MNDPITSKTTSDMQGGWAPVSCQYRKRRGKTDWAGVGIGDAFKANLDYFLKVSAQRLFYAACRRAQETATAMAGLTGETDAQPKTKPQLGPCYTTYPSSLAAYAAIGLTGFLESQAVAGSGCLIAHLADYLKNPAMADAVPTDPKTYSKVVRLVAHAVEARLLLEDLSRAPGMAAVELYRLFAASQQNTKFETLPAIVHAVILYGDVLPRWENMTLHPMTRTLFRITESTSTPYFRQLPAAKPEALADLGVAWVRSVGRTLSRYLPRAKCGAAIATRAASPSGAEPVRIATGNSERFAEPGEPSAANTIAPLNGPNPPTLFSPPTAVERAVEGLLGKPLEELEEEEPSSEDTQAVQSLQQFSNALDMAGGQNEQWQDMRSDIVERSMMADAFAESPIQGSPADGHEVTLRLGHDNVVGGEIHDRPVALSDSLSAVELLEKESTPMADALRRALYPNIAEQVETERLRSSGALDATRLAVAEFSTVVFKRYRIREKADSRGQPLLLIACDGSGSLNRAEMRMLKVLAAAWLNSTVRSHVQVMAGLYHSGEIRRGISGPLVQWMYHPHKTPAISRKDALRALVSLPDSGTGVQSDALSLQFMLSEAVRIARGRMVYLILVSDCAWNRSFDADMSGKEEVHSLFEHVYAESDGNIHTTLVALGKEGQTGFEDLLDKVITVPANRLEDYAGLAEQIGVYVATCMKERRHYMAKN